MIVTVGSWRGVGATSTALLAAVAAAGDGPAWLVEADPAGGVLAGRMAIDGERVGGLERVAFGPEHASAIDAFESVAHCAGNLHVVTAPADPFRAHSCHTPRVPWAQMLDELPGLVVVDIGRVRAGSPALWLVRRSAMFLLVASPEVSSLVASVEWLTSAGRVSAADQGVEGTPMRMVLVDAPGGVAFPRATLERELTDHWGGWLPWEPATVDLVHRGADAADRRVRRGALMPAVERLMAATVPVDAPTDAPTDVPADGPMLAVPVEAVPC
jgi:hypothetical protein